MENNLTTTEGAVLGLVAFGRRSGYELARIAKRTIGHLWTPSQSQIYKTLPRLVGAGLVRRRAVEQHGRPDKALYTITTAGRAALRAWLDDVEPEPAGGRIIFPLKVFFCEFASAGTAEAQLDGYRRYLTRRLEHYHSLRDGPNTFGSEFPGYVLGHAIARTNATLGWIDETLKALRRRQAGRSSPRRAASAADRASTDA